MKKWFNFEVALLLLVLIVAIVCLTSLSGKETVPTVSGGLDKETTLQTQETTETRTEATEPTWMVFPESRKLTAKQAFVYDCQKEEFTFLLGEETDTVYPASITKLFTAYVALQYLSPTQEITAGDALELVGVGSSVAGIEKDDILSVEMLVQAMLLPSGNDAAYILAAEVGRILEKDHTLGAWYAVDAFLEEMNKQAKDLGLTGTHFTNPDGYHDAEHYTNFKDMAAIGKLSMENETIMRYAKVYKEQITFSDGIIKDWENTNALVNPASEYYCPVATGLKTGQTPSAGSCLLSSFDADGEKYLIGVFGCPEIEDRFEDTLQLLNDTLN